MILPVVAYGASVLRKTAKDIDQNYKGLNELINNMFETMYKSEGVGLAAPQVDRSIRLFVIDATPLADEVEELEGFKKVFINAKIVERSGEIESKNEGCLSIPNIRENVMREEYIRIQYYDQDFEFHDEEYSGWPARIISHEYDHLDGILFTDKISPIRKRLIRKKLQAISKGKVAVDYRMKFPG